MMRNEILKKIQKEGLAILKLHEKLNELNIDHDFFDRKTEQLEMIKENKAIDILNDIYIFDYQILIEENRNQISLVQSPYTYGITNNLIEVYNFQHEPVILDHEIAATLISKKQLNSYIITINEKNDEKFEKIKEMFQSLNIKTVRLNNDKKEENK